MDVPLYKFLRDKYGLDEGKVHQETSTLLEPNNFIPSWVSYFE